MAKKHETSEILAAISEKCPGARVVVLNVDDDRTNPNADVAFTANLSPADAARYLRWIGTDMCRQMKIPPDAEA